MTRTCGYIWRTLRDATHDSLLPLVRYIFHHPIRTICLFFSLLLLIAFYHSLPIPLFDEPTCTVLTDRNGALLAATIAKDGQYRFAPLDSAPPQFAECAVAYEDRFFYWHMGVNPVAVATALKDNLQAGRIVRGASTLTMQVARMMRRGSSRTFANKLKEAVWALRLELRYSKREILALWASYAPFGGNVVGLEAAAWRYYQTSPWNLSWGQAAALAVLPNAPAVIYPGVSNEAFRRKRDRLLHTLHARGVIDEMTLALALEESLPAGADPLPQLAVQLLGHAIRDGYEGQTVRTTLDITLQREAERAVLNHAEEQMGQQISNAGALILHAERGEVLAYVGNVPGLGAIKQGYVNTILAKRSSGSILKPFLYADMLDEGMILPTELIPDIPMKIGSFAPMNAHRTFQGAVPARQALSLSLNVPTVRMLRAYGVEAFLELLQHLGATTFNRGANIYGLSLILGGGECTLWEMCGIYASLSRTLRRFTEEGHYFSANIHAPHYVLSQALAQPRGRKTQNSPLGAGSIYLTFEALREVNRPEEEIGWQHFSSTRSVAWKTGTSWGARDAWAIGVNRDYVVGVWVGNATGAGQPGNSGVSTAAPLMFQLWGLLPHTPWFNIPWDDLHQQPICRASGSPPSPICPDVDTILTVAHNATHSPCPYHELVHLDSSGQWRVNSSCYSVHSMRTQPWFILPPAQAWYYAQRNPHYTPLPPWLEGCSDDAVRPPMQFIYPRNNGTLLSIPRDMDGRPTVAQFEVAHLRPEAKVFWHLDGEYVGYTLHTHFLPLRPDEGEHELTVVDEQGNRNSIRFRVLYSAVE